MQATIRVSRPRQRLVFMFLMVLFAGIEGKSWGQTVFTDNFNRTTYSSGGTPTMTYITGSTGSPNINSTSNYLTIIGIGTNGNGYVTGTTSTFNSPYSPTLASNTNIITWTFNFRWNRASSNNPAQPSLGGYGQTVVLAASGANIFNGTSTTGYAIEYGSSGTPDPVRLVSFTGGVAGTLTDVISTGTSNLVNTNDYVSVKVTYNPTNNNWSLFVRDDGTTAWADPVAGTYTQTGTTVANSTYTGVSLQNFGYVFSFAGSTSNSGDFDNFSVNLSSAASVNYYWNGSNTSTLDGTWDNTSVSWSTPSATTTLNAAWPSSATNTYIANFNGAGGGTVTLPGTIAAVPSATNIGSSTYTFASGTANAALDGLLSIGTNTLTFAPSSGNIAVTGNITGSGAILSNSASTGNLNLSGTNTGFTGTVISTTTGSGSGKIRFDSKNALTAGILQVNNGGSIKLNTAETYGATAQALQLNPNQTANPAFDIGITTGTTTWQGTVALQADSRIEAASSTTLVFTGNLSGTGKLIKQAGGTLALSGIGNTNTGGTQIGNGTIAVAIGSSLGTGDLAFAQTSTNATTITLSNASQTIGNLSSTWIAVTGTIAQTLTLTGTALTINQTTSGTFGDGAINTLSSVITGTGSVIKAGAGALILTSGNTYTGGTTINAGSLVLGKGNILAAAGTITLSGGTLSTGTTTGYNETVGVLTLANSSTIALGTGAHSLKFANSSAATWAPSTTLTITNWIGSFNGATGTAGHVYIGTTSTGVTAIQLAQIRFQSGSVYYPATILSTGEIVPTGPEIDVLQGTTAIASGGSYAFGNVASGSTSDVVFTIQNNGTAALSISGIAVTGTGFSLVSTAPTSIAAGSTATFMVRFSPVAFTSYSGVITITSNDFDEGSYVVNLTGTGTGSTSSDIIADVSYTYNDNIDYTLYQSTDITTTANSIDAFQFIIRDGGGSADADILPTVLNSITFSSIQNVSSLRDAALYDGNTLLSSVSVINATNNTISFSNLLGTHATAADNGIKTLTLRVSFLTSVTEQQLRFSITAANTVAATSGSSQFSSSFTTIQSSVTPTTRNKVSVTAIKLVFLQQPPSMVSAGTVISPSVSVKAIDANGNTDVDYASSVTLSITTAVCNSLSGNTTTAAAGVATFTSLAVNVTESGITLKAASGTLTNTTSSSFTVTDGASTSATVVNWNFEDKDATSDGGNTNNSADVISTTTGGTISTPSGMGGAGTYAIASDNWQNGSGTKYWLISINATGYQSLTLSSKQSSSGTGPANFKIQYQVGNTGTWTDLFTLPAITKSAPDFTEAVAASVALPSACDNQPVVNIRWIMTSNTPANTGSTVATGGTNRIDDIVVIGQSGTIASNLYYQTKQSGAFESACIWESSSDNVTFTQAATPPDVTSKTISILSGHVVTINATHTLDELVINAGGTLTLNDVTLTLSNGAGIDFTVNGTYNDNASSANSVVFNTGTTWSLGASGTFIKTRNSSASVYTNNYDGGMSTIPSAANWIIRYTGTSDVTFTNINTYYPNLTFENATATAFSFSSLTGNTGFATVKGNLDIGGTVYTTGVTVTNLNTNSSPLLINGNLFVRTGSVLTNAGTTPGNGFEVKSNISVDGTLTANGGVSTGTFNLTGTTQQTVSGAGAINLNNVTINNTATAIAKGVFLSRDISAGGLLLLTSGPFIINGRTLTLGGAVSHNNGSITGSATSNLVLNGSAAKALYFTNPGNVLHNVTINAGAASVSLNNALDITSGSAFGTVICNGTLQTNGYLTLKSDIGGTAAVGQSSGVINGNVTVERYTDGNLNAGQSRRAWRLLTSPVTGQTIRQAWQENGGNATSYGTLITGENMPDAATAALQGYDFTGAGFHTSIKHYISSSNSWLPLSSDGSTTGTKVAVRTEQAYMLFVRGDRTVTTSGSSIATLRATGTLLQGTQTAVPLSGGSYTLIGNPYASSIDFAGIYNHNVVNNNPQIQNQFYIWNSKLGTYGAYALIRLNPDNSGNYQAVPSAMSGLGTQNNDAYRYIPSGSGFFVFPNAGATSGVVIQESDKALTGVPPINPFRVAQAPGARQLFINLNLKDGDTSVSLADGFAAAFSDDYKGYERDNSVLKVSNFNENLGLVRDNTDFIVEAHGEVRKTDTLYMKMWYVTKRSYQLQMREDNFTTAPGIQAWLVDNYLGTKQQIALAGSVTSINFEVNSDSLSARSDRFLIVFENNESVLPVTITKVKATPSNGGVEVNWTVVNEVNVKGYTIEKSGDGRTFAQMGTQQAAHNNAQAAVTSYSGYDATPKVGDNFYRIRIEAKDGTVTYSEVVKVTIGQGGTGIQITLYPNPVREGKANLSLTNLKEGTYLVSVYTGSGQTVYQKKVSITLGGTTQTESLILGNNLAQGSYQIKVSDNKGKVIKEKNFIVTK